MKISDAELLPKYIGEGSEFYEQWQKMMERVESDSRDLYTLRRGMTREEVEETLFKLQEIARKSLQQPNDVV